MQNIILDNIENRSLCNVRNFQLPHETERLFTYYSYSDKVPYLQIKRTNKTVTLVRIRTKVDPQWKEAMNWVSGGFAGQCTNQGSQTWLFKDLDADNPITIHWSGRGWGKGKFRRGHAIKFYDYNF